MNTTLCPITPKTIKCNIFLCLSLSFNSKRLSVLNQPVLQSKHGQEIILKEHFSSMILFYSNNGHCACRSRARQYQMDIFPI